MVTVLATGQPDRKENHMTISALVITPSGEIHEEALSHTLPELQKLVGGHIEQIPSKDMRLTIFGNEEAKLVGLEPNPYATEIWWMVMPEARDKDTIHGTAVITGGVDEDGNTMTLEPEVRNAIVEALVEFKKGLNA